MFDFTAIFEDDAETIEEIEIVEIEKEVKAFGKTMLLSDAINICDEKINEANAIITKWIKKEYKKSSGTCLVGDEMIESKFSYNYINEKRRNNRINANQEIVDEYENYKNKLKEA